MIASALAQQNSPSRIPGSDSSLTQMQAPATNRVVIKFREGSQVGLKDEQLIDRATGQVDAVQNVLRQMGIATPLRRMFGGASEAEINAQREEAERNSSHALPNLNLYFTLVLPPNVTAAEVADRLRALPNVESVEAAPTPRLPPAAPVAPVPPPAPPAPTNAPNPTKDRS